jgi:hypothetical protein
MDKGKIFYRERVEGRLGAGLDCERSIRTSSVLGGDDDVRAMRNMTSVDPPDLFTPDLITDNEPSVSSDSSSATLARDFVRWCWGVGEGFHNSPDGTNLRFWLDKSQGNATRVEEDQILVEARRLYLKKVEQSVRKADVPKVAD